MTVAKKKVSPINPDFAIKWWDVERPRDYPLNARKWKPAAVAKVAQSIADYGWRQPIVVDEAGVIVIGHLRRAAARHAGLSQVPVHVAAGLSPEAIRGLRLADNRTHDEAEWDLDLLAREFGELKALDFDLASTSFSLREIDTLTRKPDPAEDDVPPVPEVPTTRLGDLWVMGDHRLLCGDSTDAASVARLLVDAKPFLMVTDPPYGVEYSPVWREEYDDFKRHAVGEVPNDDRVDWEPAYRLFPGNVVYVWHAGIYAGAVAQGIVAAGLEIRAQVIWRKQHFVFGRGAYHWAHEPCWYAVRKGAGARWVGDRKQSTVWDVQNLNPMGGNTTEAATGHGTQKPVELMRRPILNHTVSGEAVYDPFLGSGTTMIAAESTGRACFGLDVDPAYCDVILARWEELTGKTATLEETHQTFAQVKQSRLVCA